MLKQSLFGTLVVATLLVGCNKPADSSTQSTTQSADTAAATDNADTNLAAADNTTTDNATTENTATDSTATDTEKAEAPADTALKSDTTSNTTSDTISNAQTDDAATNTKADAATNTKTADASPAAEEVTPVVEKKPLPEHHPKSETTAAKAGVTPEPVPEVVVDSTVKVPASEQY